MLSIATQEALQTSLRATTTGIHEDSISDNLAEHVDFLYEQGLVRWDLRGDHYVLKPTKKFFEPVKA